MPFSSGGGFGTAAEIAGMQTDPEAIAAFRKQQNKQRIADMLLQQGLQPIQGQMAGRFYVPPSWSQGLAQLAKAGAGAYGTYQNNKDITDQAQQMAQTRDVGRQEFLHNVGDVPAVPPSNLNQGPPPVPPREQLAKLLGPQGDQSNLPQGIPGGQELPSTPHMGNLAPSEQGYPNEPTDQAAGIVAPSMPTPSSPPLQPREQVAQAMSQPPPQMQGPVSPGTPGRQRTPEELQQAITQALLTNDPILRHAASYVGNQAEARSQQEANRELRKEELGYRHEEKQQLTDIQQKQWGLDYDMKTRDLEAKHGEVAQKMADANTNHADMVRLREQQLGIERDRLSLERDRVAREKMPTDAQGAANLYASRADIADQTLGSLEGQYSPLAIDYKQRVGNTWIFGGALEAGANKLLSKESQRAEQAQRDFVNAVLRKESGAVISKDEFDNARKQYFPQANDLKDVIEQKRVNRQTEIQGLRQMSGKLNPGPSAAPVPPPQGMTPTVPAFHDPEKQQRYEEFKKNHTP